MRQHKGFVYSSALCAVLAATSWTSASFAQENGLDQSMSVPPPSAPPSVEGSRSETKDTLLGTGLFLLAVSYLPAVSVAASSTVAADQHLYAPLAGPWIDLAQRPVCSPPANCEAEQTNRALLETSGILQGVGAFLTLVGLLTSDDDDDVQRPPPKHVNDAKATRVNVTPAQFGSAGYGVAAFGKF
ncbi:MAG TPA: hypothetical protein VK762_03040 [Polyangiaceae bacterium]|jgi:hypothetical protein|nr:hypothetical protein [Polyangiaceae bacterium]